MTGLPRFAIAAAHKSSGKTVVATGLAAALTERGLAVAPFKKGPDYIDPMWLALAAGRPCYNLDFNTMERDELRALFASRAAAADVSLIEANKGLYDGVELDGSDSNAELAKLLAAPVLLVVDTRGMTRGIAPLLQGYVNFDPEVAIAGVILNKTGGSRHEGKLRRAVEQYTDLAVLGAVGHDPALDISERHLGLITPAETAGTARLVRNVAARIGAAVDLDAVLRIARAAPGLGAPALPADLPAHPATAPAGAGPALRIGIARDEAFGFYYADDLEAFAAAGAELVPVDMLGDPALPDDIDGLFIGGGFPEERMRELAANESMRTSVRAALEAGLPAYAECGGLMYLCRSLRWRGTSAPMAGFFDADAVMHDRPQGRGYVRFTATGDHPWTTAGGERRAHEFHYASLENLGTDPFARAITRGHGIDGARDGLVRKNTLAGFVHLRNGAATGWVREFLAFVAGCKARARLERRYPAPAMGQGRR